MDSLKIVLGLGNPGRVYRSTRHNVGFRVVDTLARRHRVELQTENLVNDSEWSTAVRVGPGCALFGKPRTYMNRSGYAALALCRRHAVAPTNLIVVYDDADLALGRVRVRRSGGSGGHNGIRSLVEVLGTAEFARVRLGVRGERRQETDLADYVLAPFESTEEPLAEALIDRGADAVESVLERGLTETMNRFNRAKDPADDPEPS